LQAWRRLPLVLEPVPGVEPVPLNDEVLVPPPKVLVLLPLP